MNTTCCKPVENVNKKEWNNFINHELMKMAGGVTGRMVARGYVPRREQEDVTMGIVTRFLEKSERIRQGYGGRAAVRSYCFAVLMRMGNEMVRKYGKAWYQVREYEVVEEENHSGYVRDVEEQVVLRDEVRWLNRALMLSGSEKGRLVLFMKVMYNMEITDDDMIYYGGVKRMDALRSMLEGCDSLSKGERYKLLAELVNSFEGKEMSGDAIRMWLNARTERLIDMLNGGGGSAGYTRESFQLLFEYSFQRIRENSFLKAVSLFTLLTFVTGLNIL